MTEELNQIWKKNNKERLKKEIFKIILLVFTLGLINYAFEFFNEYSEGYYIAENEAIQKKKPNDKNLKEIKAFVKKNNPELYNKYLTDYATFKKAKNNFNKSKEIEKFYGFKSKYFFMDRFGKNTSKFLFSLFTLFLVLSTYKNTSKLLLFANALVVVTFMMTAIFDYLWIFNKFQNLSKLNYYVFTFTISLGITYALIFIFKDKKTYEDKIRDKTFLLAKKSIEMSSPENRAEMVEFIKRIAAEK